MILPDQQASTPSQKPSQLSAADIAAMTAALCAWLDENKAEEIMTIDLQGKTSIADKMIIASGRSGRQVSSLAQKAVDLLRENYNVRARVEGKAEGDWVLIDAHDIIIHLFRPEVRQFYALEKMWAMPNPSQAPNVRSV